MARVTRSALAASQNHAEPAQQTTDELLISSESNSIAPEFSAQIETTAPETPTASSATPLTPSQHHAVEKEEETTSSTEEETTTPLPLSNLASPTPVAPSPARQVSPHVEPANSPALENSDPSTFAEFDPALSPTVVGDPPFDLHDEDKSEDRRESVEQSPTRRIVVKSDVPSTKSAVILPPNPANSFKARPVPVYPTQQPRMTKTTALRLGLEQTSSASSRTRQSSGEDATSTSPVGKRERGAISTTAERAQAFGADHRRADSVGTVSSTARPKVEVRMTKAAALRTGVDWPKKERVGGALAALEGGKRPSSVSSARESIGINGASSPASDVGARPKPIQRQQSSTFSVTSQGSQSQGTSNATRRSSGIVGSTRPPKIEPRMDRTTKLRLGLDIEAKRIRADAPVDFEGVAGHRRKETISVPSTTLAPSIQPRLNRSIHLQRTGTDNVISAASRRATAAALAAASLPSRAPKVIRPSTAPPRIAPVMNRTEQLRAAKKEAEVAKEAKEARREAIWKAKGLAGPTAHVGKPLSEIN